MSKVTDVLHLISLGFLRQFLTHVHQSQKATWHPAPDWEQAVMQPATFGKACWTTCLPILLTAVTLQLPSQQLQQPAEAHAKACFQVNKHQVSGGDKQLKPRPSILKSHT